MKKRNLFLGLISIAFLIGGITIGFAAAEYVRTIKAEIRPDITVAVDGEVKNFTNAQGELVYPLLYEGTTYLPVRAIGNLMGKTVYWYENEKKIELKDDKTTVTDADVIVKNDEKNNADIKDSNKTETASITVEEAKKIALKKAGFTENDVKFIKAEKDYDNGKLVYEIDFVKDTVEYEAEILASDGSIVKWEIDR